MTLPPHQRPPRKPPQKHILADPPSGTNSRAAALTRPVLREDFRSPSALSFSIQLQAAHRGPREGTKELPSSGDSRMSLNAVLPSGAVDIGPRAALHVLNRLGF